MIRATAIALPLVTAATFAAAQDVQGTCRDGALWWGTAGAAGLGPCESPEEGFFVLTCAEGQTRLRVTSPYPVAAGQRGTVDVSVDGRRWRLEGRGADDARTGQRILDQVDIPGDVLDALAAGATASFYMPTETRPIHLTGSQAALTAMRTDC
ncbi:hypothetical protein JANAI62_16030 [Jannaschia pagri]|uniref:Invasion protein IalB, involved in pathogenesis n=1 Tax=Jannaschia pagri TaxID=2829797 RepID=A0ABQ4NL69_9RHOB|nr:MULTISPECIES: hypothetical protein [unclassified Jannaschia]GIT91148.1 hypothetical protein JANAI61_16060 [Jannaschia sp. AI_61]GIT94980.1 hypothetical protein JANAI62_16030 [Jannaschia sp. AI_62]